MKTRAGFVSNSSSSSYVIATTKRAADEALSKVHPYTKAVVEWLNPTTKKVDGIELFIVSWMDGNYSSFEGVTQSEIYDGEIPEGEWSSGPMGCDEAMSTFEKALGDNKIASEVDC